MSSMRNVRYYKGKSRHMSDLTISLRVALLWMSFAGALVSCLMLGYLVLFTSPRSFDNLLAFYVIFGLGVVMAAWFVGYEARRKFSPDKEHPSTIWPCTRQSLLLGSGALITLMLIRNGVQIALAVLLVSLCIVLLEMLFTWVEARD